jgi:hypothetical protein
LCLTVDATDFGISNQRRQMRIAASGTFADHRVPGRDGQLAGDDRGSPSVPILEDFEKVVPALSPERLQAPVVEDEEIDGAQALETTRGAAVAMGKGELVKEFRDPDV